MKKRLILAAVFMVALCVACFALFAAEAEAAELGSGVCGDNLTWVLTDDGTLTISGTGAMKDYSPYGTPWWNDRDTIKTVIIEEGVTSLGNYAFNWCKQITYISLPDSLTKLGRESLAGCESLISIEIPKNVSQIDHLVFSDSGLKHVIFTGDAPKFGNYVFNYIYVTAYFPADNATWTRNVQQDYGGSVTWTSYEPDKKPDVHVHQHNALVTAPTCTEGGYTTYTCACGDTYVEDIKSALGHTYGEWTQVKVATTEEAGLEERVCGTCGGKEQRELAKLEPAPTEPEPTAPDTEISATTPAGDETSDEGNDSVVVIAAVATVGTIGIGAGAVLTILKKRK